MLELIQLEPAMAKVRSIFMLDWAPAPVLQPNTALLTKMHKTRSRQSAISRKRQNIISGMSFYRAPGEAAARQRYLAEQSGRLSENEY